MPGGVGAAHDHRELVQRRVVQLEMLDKGVERAEIAVMRERLGTRDVVRRRADLLGDREHAVGRDVNKFGVWLDKASDQPGTGDAVDLRTLARDPFGHRDAPCLMSGVSGTVGAPMACQAVMPPTRWCASNPRPLNSAVAAPLTWRP